MGVPTLRSTLKNGLVAFRMIFFNKCSCSIDLRFPANLTLTVRCFLLIYYLQLKYFESVLIDLHDHKQISAYILIKKIS